MTTLIIIFAVLLVLGSSLWILPSAKQREQMRLRREAMMKGLQVKLTQIKDLDYPGEVLKCIAYRMERRGKPVNKQQTWMLYRHPESEQSLSIPGWIYDTHGGLYRFPETTPIAELLAELPQDVKAVEGGLGSVSVYWNERGDSDDLATIQRVLDRLQSL